MIKSFPKPKSTKETRTNNQELLIRKQYESDATSRSNQQPSQVVAGLSQSDNSPAPVNTLVEQKVTVEESEKTITFYAKDANKNAQANTYKEPAFIMK